MAQILVRGLDDALVARLKDRARQNHRSLQGEVRAILEEVAPLARGRLWPEMAAIGEKKQGKIFSDSAEIIRRMRDA
jgi:plasmid stability protein